MKDLHEYALNIAENTMLDKKRRDNISQQRLNPDVDRKYNDKLGGEQHPGINYRDRDSARMVQQGRAPDPGPDKLRMRPTDYYRSGGSDSQIIQPQRNDSRPVARGPQPYGMGAREKAYENPISKAGTKFTSVRRGASGDNVKELQTSLGITADGKFGKGTEAAVRAYQKKHGLKVDGIIGDETMSKIRRDKEVQANKGK